MKLNRLLGILNFDITNEPTPITLPEKYENASLAFIGVQKNNEPIYWRRRSSGISETSKLFVAPTMLMPIAHSTNGTPVFYAETLTGSGILEMELWV